MKEIKSQDKIVHSTVWGINHTQEVKQLPRQSASPALVCECACMCLPLCGGMCACIYVCMCVHTPSVQGSGCLPQCSTPGRLPSSGVLSCSVSQPRCAPTRTMDCVTFEQTNVMRRGASQTSSGNSTMRTYIMIPAHRA